SQMAAPALSPDGSRVAVQAQQDGNTDIWVHEVGRALKSRLTFDPFAEQFPRWSPDGKEIAFSSDRNGHFDLFSRTADNSGEQRLLFASPKNKFAGDWSSDGKYLLYTLDPNAASDLGYLKRKPDGSGFDSALFLQTPFVKAGARFSPDGRFVAYVTNETGRDEVYVQPFPDGKGKWQVSANGGKQ